MQCFHFVLCSQHIVLELSCVVITIVTKQKLIYRTLFSAIVVLLIIYCLYCRKSKEGELQEDFWDNHGFSYDDDGAGKCPRVCPQSSKTHPSKKTFF